MFDYWESVSSLFSRSILYYGREVRYQADYILGTNSYLFRNMSVREPMHNSDHNLILGCLRSATLRYHKKYIGRSMWIPLLPPTTHTR